MGNGAGSPLHRQSHAGWAPLFAIVLLGALAAIWRTRFVLWQAGPDHFGYAPRLHFFFAYNSLLPPPSFFVWTLPRIKRPTNWTVVPNTWMTCAANGIFCARRRTPSLRLRPFGPVCFIAVLLQPSASEITVTDRWVAIVEHQFTHPTADYATCSLYGLCITLTGKRQDMFVLRRYWRERVFKYWIYLASHFLYIL